MSNENRKIKTAVIGGGASGMLAAIFASRGGADVTVFEAKDTLGKKINATGNGKCNYTNMEMSPKYYRGTHPDFVVPALKEFNERDTIEFFKSIGIMPKVKNGYVYPNSEQASSVSLALSLACREEGVKIINSPVTRIKSQNNAFLVNDSLFDTVVLACGSFANMKDTASFNGYELVKNLGHNVTRLYPALVQLRSSEKYLRTINGVRCEGLIKLYSDGKEIAREQGELLFSDKGISGIPAMQISRYAAEHIDKGHSLCAKVDFFPELDSASVEEALRSRNCMKRTVEEALTGLLNHKLNYVMLTKLGMDVSASARAMLTEKNISRLSELMKNYEFKITGTNSFDMAQVVAGGADTEQINPNTMESRLVKGLFFAGEIIDIDGTCGGYNLQWAWSSGAMAGKNAAGING